MDVLSGLGLRQKGWNPLRLLARFRANVAARNAAQSLPVERAVPQVDFQKYGCDVACLSDSAVPAQTLLAQHQEQPQTSRQRQAVRQVFDQLTRTYDAGGVIAHRAHIERMVTTALDPVPDGLDPNPLIDFLAGPINDALAREQALAWLADSTFKIHLYGPGWELHPTLRALARPFDGSEAERIAIAQGAKINLRLTPAPADDPGFAAALDAGGFLLLRYFPQDVLARIFQPLYRFVIGAAITTDEDLIAISTSGITRLLDFAAKTLGMSVFEAYPSFVSMLRKEGADKFAGSPGLLREYDSVAFSSRQQFLDLIGKYLYDEPQRQRIAASMRERTSAGGEPFFDPPQTGEVAA